MILAVDVCKIYRDGDLTVEAIKSCHLSIAAAERVALLGSSGSGKTTLLNLLAGLDRPTSGKLVVADQNLSALTTDELACFRRDQIGVVFQSFELIPQKSALQNVELPLMLAGLPRRTRHEQATELLDRVGLSKRMHHRPYQLSGGEKQRVAVARAMVCRPAILMADEPTGNLDSLSRQTVMELMTQLADDFGSTLLLITHDRSLAKKYTDRVLEMQDGRVVEAETK